MTKLLTAALAGLIAGLSAAPQPPATRAAVDRVAVVVDASGTGAAARIATARADARTRDATFRAPRTLSDQLAVTARLAAEEYATVVGYGLEAHVAIAPLDGRLRYVDAG